MRYESSKMGYIKLSFNSIIMLLEIEEFKNYISILFCYKKYGKYVMSYIRNVCIILTLKKNVSN